MLVEHVAKALKEYRCHVVELVLIIDALESCVIISELSPFFPVTGFYFMQNLMHYVAPLYAKS